MKLTDWKKEFRIEDDGFIREHANRIGDQNPLHHNAEMAMQFQKLTGIVMPGMAILNHITALIAQEVPGVIICGIDKARFYRPVYAPTLLSLFFTVSKKKMRRVEVEIGAIDDNRTAISATCLLWLPETVRAESIAA